MDAIVLLHRLHRVHSRWRRWRGRPAAVRPVQFPENSVFRKARARRARMQKPKPNFPEIVPGGPLQGLTALGRQSSTSRHNREWAGCDRRGRTQGFPDRPSRRTAPRLAGPAHFAASHHRPAPPAAPYRRVTPLAPGASSMSGPAMGSAGEWRGVAALRPGSVLVPPLWGSGSGAAFGGSARAAGAGNKKVIPWSGSGRTGPARRSRKGAGSCGQPGSTVVTTAPASDRRAESRPLCRL